jgi:hypothetical protein
MTSETFYALWLPAFAALAGSLAATSVRLNAPARFDMSAIAPHLPALAVVGGATACLAAMVLPGAGWGFTDDDVFILHYLRGDAYPPPLWPDVGRFFPLGHQEWRLLYLWTDSAAVYYAVAVMQYAAFGLGLYLVLRELRAPGRLVLLFALTLPPVFVAFGNLVVQERMQALFLPWLLLALLRWDRTRRFQYAFLALVAAHFMLYVKEPTVLFLLPLAALRLAPPARDALGAIASKDLTRLEGIGRASLADLGVLLSCAAFLALYFSAVPLDTLFSDRVYDGRSLSAGGAPSALWAWATKEPLLIALLAAGFARFGAHLAWRRAPDFHDQVLVGATLYFASLVASGLVSSYYGTLPLVATTIAVVPPLAALASGRPGLRSVFGAGLALALAVNLLAASSHLAYRQDWIDRNHQLTARLERLLGADPSERVVFLRGHSWDAEMLSVYANGHRRLGITFLIADLRYRDVDPATAARCDGPANRCLAYAASPPEAALVADLGRLERDRSVVLSGPSVTVWHFDDERLRSLQAFLPAPVDTVTRHFYDHW